MVAQFSVTALQELLIQGLDLISQDWALTPLLGNKAPYRTAWQHESPLARNQIIAEIESGQAQGYGIRTGTVSGGIVAMDFDGPSAMQKALELSGGELLPDTITFTSNRPGREQRLYTIPNQYWANIKTVKIKTGEVGDDGKLEQLELRWDGCQSVLPPSVHPMTGHYRWRRSPTEVAIAPAPMWVIEAMLVEPEPQQSERYATAYTRKARTGEEWTNEEWALAYLSALNSYRADDYDDWVAVGMALHSVSDSLLADWDNWSQQSTKYSPGCCEKKWKSFKRQGVAIGTLGHMAKQDGWRNPFDNNSPDSRKSVTSRDKSEPKLDIVERFKADLLTLTNADDPIVQLLKINELAATYRMPAGEIRKAIAKVETATRTPKAQFFKLDEFLSLETEGIDYLIPGLLPRGETVLCVGLPKLGKTLLTIDAAFAVATGESKFLGETVQQGKVLVVSVDESAQSTKLKLMKRGFRASDAENIAVMTTWDVSQMGELEAKLEDFRPDLVIIDSLKRITAGREISENSAEFADIIYQLKELLGRYGASGILIHHSNKSQDAVGVGKVRGSTAIAGACWGIWQLDYIIQTTDENGKPIKGKPKFDPSDPRRIFTAICRDADSQTLTIQFNPENHSFCATSEDSEAQQERKTQEQLILELLTHYHPNGLSGREIMEALGLGRGIYTILDRMVGRKTVTQRQSKTDSRSMVYALPKKRDTHPPSPSLQMLTKFSESTVVEPKTNSQQIVNNESPDSQRRFDQKADVDYSTPEQMDVSEDSQQLLATGGGVSLSTDEFTELNADELSHTQPVEEAVTLTPGLQLATLLEMCESWEQVEAVTEAVEPDAKTEAWSLLPSEEQSRIRALKKMTNCQLLNVGDRVFVESCPHTDAMGPYEVLGLEGEFAQVEMFAEPVRLADLRKP
jgi:hypothetical protein